MAEARAATVERSAAKAASNITGTLPARPILFGSILLSEVTHDDLFLRASALAYGTIASLVPIVAIILAVLSGPSFQDQRESVLNALAEGLVPSESAPAAWVVTEDTPEQHHFKEVFREQIEGLASKLGAVSIFGFLILLATAGLLFRQVEGALNAIWRSTVRRTFPMRVAIATSVIFWGPVILALSVTISEKLGRISPFFGSYIIPSLLTTMAFTALYMILPHTKVHFRYAAIGGAIAALLWEFSKLGFLVYVTRMVSYNRVYGSLGLLPMLFLWVYINWVLILLGAEIAFCLQNWEAVKERWLKERKQPEAESRSTVHAPPSVVLAVAIEVARRFGAFGGKGVRASELAHELCVDPGFIQSATERLVGARILAGVEGEEIAGDPAFLPACDPAKCDISVLLAAACDEKEPVGKGAAIDRAWSLLQATAKLRTGNAKTLGELAGVSSNPGSSSAPG